MTETHSQQPGACLTGKKAGYASRQDVLHTYYTAKQSAAESAARSTAATAPTLHRLGPATGRPPPASLLAITAATRTTVTTTAVAIVVLSTCYSHIGAHGFGLWLKIYCCLGGRVRVKIKVHKAAAVACPSYLGS